MERLSELGKILTVGAILGEGDRSADYLGRMVGVSRATFMRYLGELRHMGCEIVSRREATGSVYRLENGDAVFHRLRTWLELERRRTLLDVDVDETSPRLSKPTSRGSGCSRT